MTSNCFAVFSSLNDGDYCFFKILHNLVSLLIQFEYIYVFTHSVLQNVVETLFPSGCPQRSVGGTKRSDKQTEAKGSPLSGCGADRGLVSGLVTVNCHYRNLFCY